MYEEIHFRFSGVAPLLLHNIVHFIDPMDVQNKAFKKLTSVKSNKRTDEQNIEMAHMEWCMCFYLDEHGVPCLPGENIEACLADGARMNSLGKKFAAGVLSDGNWPIIHDGPMTIKALWKIDAYRDMRPARVGQSKVNRCRPIFHSWSVEPVVHFLPEIIDAEQVVSAAENAGRYKAIGDYRPKFGRFEVEVLSNGK